MSSVLLCNSPDGEMDGPGDARFNDNSSRVIKVVLWKLANCEVHFHWNRVCKHHHTSDLPPTHTCLQSFIQVKFIWLSLWGVERSTNVAVKRFTRCLDGFSMGEDTHTHTHTHTCMSVCVWVCVCVCAWFQGRAGRHVRLSGWFFHRKNCFHYRWYHSISSPAHTQSNNTVPAGFNVGGPAVLKVFSCRRVKYWQ